MLNDYINASFVGEAMAFSLAYKNKATVVIY